ncbi:hypothetical protein [Roseburia sp. MSJ-14]|uniref:hypothetical protein n=1 Tax=Roseburia sp. MSJ-14 TaxID=2841514 RepID=UPI001C11353D|nr:hypothetical protein [Roseburia sp. MSJ-14]MBU5473577.1 hypothetical protein [Roseburia sp. MSJ-14]
MTVEEAIRKYVDENEGYEIYENYSGRGMFGRKCLGVVVKQGCSFMDFLMKLTKYMDDNNVDDVDFKLEGTTYDNLGLDTVVYFPNIGGDCV